MIANPQYDLSRPLATALKAKAPFVGIPMPGHAPLILRRAFLQRVLKGVQPIHVEVHTHESGARSLIVQGTAGPRVRCRYSIPVMDRRHLTAPASRGNITYECANEFQSWKAKVIAAKVDPDLTPANSSATQRRGLKTKQTTLAKLERELAKLGKLGRIPNPAVPLVHPHAAADHTPARVAEYLAWRAQRRLRTVLGAIAKVNARRSLQAQIDSIRALIQPGAAPAPPEASVAQIVGMERYQTARQHLLTAQHALDMFHRKVRAWAHGHAFEAWNGGREIQPEPAGEWERTRWVDWRAAKPDRRTQSTRRHQRIPETAALGKAISEIDTQAFVRGQGGNLRRRRVQPVYSPAETQAKVMLQQRLAAIEAEIKAGTRELDYFERTHRPRVGDRNGRMGSSGQAQPPLAERAREYRQLRAALRQAETEAARATPPGLNQEAA